ncbi:MAG: hypothetical protein R3254_04420 [Thiomicrorhabdus sp.]|nr:hypothetical protein [Thiomicrorhabdus sp.]
MPWYYVPRNDQRIFRHCERSEAIHGLRQSMALDVMMDCQAWLKVF